MEDLTPLYNKEFYLAYLCGEDVALPIPDGNAERYLAYLCGMDVEIPDVPDGRTETYLAYKCGEDVVLPDPMYRIEYYLAKWCGMDCEVPEPMYRIEYWLAQLANSGELKTVTGNPISVSDALAKPAESLVIEILPQQDLHGYANPWPAGGGVNIFDKDSATVGKWLNVSTGAEEATSNSYALTDWIPVKANTAYSFTNPSSSRRWFYDTNQDPVEAISSNPYTPSVDGFIRITISVASVDIDTFMVVKGNALPDTYSSYSNICPITGWTGVNIPRTGVNVWDEEWEVGGFSYTTGEPSTATDRIRSKNFCPCVPSTTYYFKTPNQNLRILFYDAEKAYISYEGWYDTPRTVTTPSNARFFKIAGSVAYGTTYNNDISINYPSTDHDYHAYTGTTYSISWQDEAGTVYGGEPDVTTGVLTVTHKIKVFDGTEANSWQINVNSYGYLNYRRLTDLGMADWKTAATTAERGALGTANMFPHANASWGAEYKTNNRISFTCSADGYFGFNIGESFDANTKLAEWYANGTPLTVVYEIQNPLTYQLTPTEIQMLLGNNVLWNDINGDMTLEYLADGPADDADALQILLGNRYVNNGEADEATDKEALEILLGGNTR